MQQAVFLFTQIFFVVLVIAVIGIVTFVVIKRRDTGVDSINDESTTSKSTDKLS